MGKQNLKTSSDDIPVTPVSEKKRLRRKDFKQR